MFGVSKPVIGMVHLKPLPGSPNFGGSFGDVLRFAVEDAEALVSGGVDGLMVENYWDTPYSVYVGPETVAAMSVITARIVEEFGVPVGVNVLRNDAVAALAVASASGAKFIRVNVFGGVYVSMEGLLLGNARKILEYRGRLGLDDVQIWADLRVKHAWPLTDIALTDEAKDLYERCNVNALVITGRRTGLPPNPQDLQNVRQAVPDAKIIIGSGLTLSNVQNLLSLADGAIVGTYFKRDGKIWNKVDANRVRRFMELVSTLR